METILETFNLTKKFPGKVAVNQVNLHIQKGDIYGFIGRNGAGKTTTMKLILGLLNITEGEVELFGSKNLIEGRRKIGSLIEAPGFYKNASAYENMKRYAIFTNSTDEEIKELLELVGLGNVGKKKAGQFSLGMKQRLGMAMALLGNPELLILDEPINGLDPAGIKEIRDTILKLNKEKGVTFLISSHLLDELAKITTRYGIINDGILVEEVDAKVLMERCKANLKIVVDNPEKALKVLTKTKLLDNYRIDGNQIMLYEDKIQPAEVNKILVEAGIAVSEITMNQNAFEEYFIERIGK